MRNPALVEREPEMRCIDSLLARALDRDGSVLLIEGEPGIGKTAVLDATVLRAHDLGMRALRARGGELERDLPFAVVRQLFEPAVHADSRGFHGELFAGAAALALPLLGGSERANEFASAPAVHGLYWLCANLAEQAPLLVVIDDAHWADLPSLRFVSHLARRLSELPVLLVLATRPRQWAVDVDRALTGVAPEVLRLPPLSENAVAKVVRAAMGPDADDEFCTACSEATLGNPFLLTELLADLRAASVPPVRTAVDRVAWTASATTTRSVERRLSRLGDDATAVARAIAILGPDVRPQRVAALAQVPAERVGVAVEQLVRDGIVEADLSFTHPLIRSAVVATISSIARSAAHKRVVDMLRAEHEPSTRLIPHLLATEPAGDGDVSDLLQSTAAGAIASGAPEVAVECLDRALTEPPPPASEGRIYGLLGRALAMSNRPADADTALLRAFADATDPVERAETAIELASVRMTSGRGRAAQDALAPVRIESIASHRALATRLDSVRRIAGIAALDPPALGSTASQPSYPTSIAALCRGRRSSRPRRSAQYWRRATRPTRPRGWRSPPPMRCRPIASIGRS